MASKRMERLTLENYRVCRFAIANMRCRLLATASAFLLSFTAQIVVAQVNKIPLPQEYPGGVMGVLPEYCKFTQGRPGYDGPEGKHWRSLIGEDFAHMHHYCRGLRDVYFARTGIFQPAQREFLWRRSISEYRYIVRNSKPTMVLLPEVFLRIAESHIALGEFYEFQQALERSRELNPAYWPAYTLLADELLKKGMRLEAVKILSLGIERNPESEQLVAALKRIESQNAPKSR